MSKQPARKPSKYERERAMYAKMGMKHPKDVAIDVAMENLKGFCRKLTPITYKPADGDEGTPPSHDEVPR